MSDRLTAHRLALATDQVPPATADHLAAARQPSVADQPSVELAIVVLAVVVAAALLAMLFRVVRPGERLVVFRGQRPPAVRGPGLVPVVPGRDSWVRLSIRPVILDAFWILQRSADGLPLTINAQAVLQIDDPAACALAGAPPAGTVEAAVRAEVRRLVANRNAVQLSRLDVADLEDLADRITESLSCQGMSVSRVELSRAQTDLDADLIRWADDLNTRRARQSAPAALPADRTRSVPADPARSIPAGPPP